MNCPNCQSEVPAGSNFCSRCGTQIATGQIATGSGTAAGYAPLTQSSNQPNSAVASSPQVQRAGLSDNAAAAIAYMTIIPAIVFLILEPYNRIKLVRFHALQCLGLAVAWLAINLVLRFIPVLWIVLYPIVGLAMFAIWLVCIFKASRGEFFRLPIIGDFAMQQA
jgi:uncharacterized membrane protein